nr:hypothetical protein Iba_chr06cCG16700 [Ipomoea batatas]
MREVGCCWRLGLACYPGVEKIKDSLELSLFEIVNITPVVSSRSKYAFSTIVTTAVQETVMVKFVFDEDR